MSNALRLKAGFPRQQTLTGALFGGPSWALSQLNVWMESWAEAQKLARDAQARFPFMGE